MSQPVAAPATDLAQVAVAFERWRGSRPVGARIPEALWSRAVALARFHGVAKVARASRLD
ncbi:MAG: hypothetical protein WAM94_08115 [Chromatiaceae bacterium]